MQQYPRSGSKAGPYSRCLRCTFSRNISRDLGEMPSLASTHQHGACCFWKQLWSFSHCLQLIYPTLWRKSVSSVFRAEFSCKNQIIMPCSNEWLSKMMLMYSSHLYWAKINSKTHRGLRVEIPRGVWVGEDWDVFHDLGSLQHSFIGWICWMWTWVAVLMQHSHSGTISHRILVVKCCWESKQKLLYVCNDHVSFILHIDISSFVKDRRLQSPAL